MLHLEQSLQDIGNDSDSHWRFPKSIFTYFEVIYITKNL